MIEKMLKFSKISWAERISSIEDPIDLCLRKDVPSFIQVRRHIELVYRHYNAWKEISGDFVFEICKPFSLAGPDWKIQYNIYPGFNFKGFHEEIAFLRLDSVSLAELALARSTSVSEFSHGGISIPRPYHTTGQTRGGYIVPEYESIKDATLLMVDFEHAFLVDRKLWNSACLKMKSGATLGKPVSSPTPEEFVLSASVDESDLYFMASDIEALEKEAEQSLELVHYPFDHKELMPGIYWMFQAAYALNDKCVIGEKEVLNWLNVRICGDDFKGKRGDFAAKLVPMNLSRGRGRVDGPRPFKIMDLEKWADNPRQYDLPFASDGLRLALAVAVWWLARLHDDPNTSRVVLAKKLYEQNFDQTETDHMFRLITGVHFSKVERSLFAAWAEKKDAKEESRFV